MDSGYRHVLCLPRQAMTLQLPSGLAQDFRFASRQLLRAPGFTLAAVATLALGIGINTAAFTIYESIALKPLAVRDPASLLRIVATRDAGRVRLSYADVTEIRTGTRAFASLIATSGPEPFEAARSGATAPEILAARFVSPEFFTTLGVTAALGRTFGPGDLQSVVLSDEAWRQRFQGASDVVGRTLTIRGTTLVVLGVTGPAFGGTGAPAAAPDLWIPLDLEPTLRPGVDWIHDAAQRPWEALGRLAPGVSLAQARAELAVVATRLPPIDKRPVTLDAQRASFFQTDSGEFSTFGAVSPVVLVAVALLLVIACVNLVNLVAARNASRAREISVRLALGASRARLARLLCAESVLLGFLGGGVGLVASWELTGLLRQWIRVTLPRLTGNPAGLFLDFSVDWRVLAYTLSLAIGVALIVGLAPARASARADVNAVLKQGTSSTEAPGLWRRRHWLVTFQVAGCLALLTAAGLLLAGVRRSRVADPGFDAAHTLVLSLDAPAGGYSTAGAAEAANLVRRLRSLPGVRNVAWASHAPYMGHALLTYSEPGGAVRTLATNRVSDSYFETLDIPILAGRGFTPGEVARHSPVLVLSEAAARRYWPGESPVGRSVDRFPWLAGPDSQTYTVIGVAKDVRGTFLSKVDEGFAYYPSAPSPGSTFLLRTRASPAAAVREVVHALAEFAPGLPARAHLVPLEDGPVALQRLMASLPAATAGGLALLGLLLAAVGLYGLVAQVVARRTRDIGIHMALGAQRRQVLTLILRTTLPPAMRGVALGSCGAAGLSVLLAKAVVIPDMPDFTYGAGAFAPAVFAAVLAVLAAVIGIAALVPARRATRVDPMQALRHD